MATGSVWNWAFGFQGIVASLQHNTRQLYHGCLHFPLGLSHFPFSTWPESLKPTPPRTPPSLSPRPHHPPSRLCPDEQLDEPDLRAGRPGAGVSRHRLTLRHDLHGAAPARLEAHQGARRAAKAQPGGAWRLERRGRSGQAGTGCAEAGSDPLWKGGRRRGWVGPQRQ